MTSLCRVVPVWHGLSRADLTVRLGRSGASVGHPSGSDLIGPLKRFGRGCIGLADAMAGATELHVQEGGGSKETLLQLEGLRGPTPTLKKRGWCRTQSAYNKPARNSQ